MVSNCVGRVRQCIIAISNGPSNDNYKWAAPSEFGTYRLCEQRRFRRACASAQSRQNLRCSLIQAVSQEEPSDRKPDPWPFWMAGHARLKLVMTECSKTQIRLTRPKYKHTYPNHNDLIQRSYSIIWWHPSSYGVTLKKQKKIIWKSLSEFIHRKHETMS